jgi:hypothetical protein
MHVVYCSVGASKRQRSHEPALEETAQLLKQLRRPQHKHARNKTFTFVFVASSAYLSFRDLQEDCLARHQRRRGQGVPGKRNEQHRVPRKHGDILYCYLAVCLVESKSNVW